VILRTSRAPDVTAYRFNTFPLLVAGTDPIARMHARLARRSQQNLPTAIVDLPSAAENAAGASVTQKTVARRRSDLDRAR
jgi:hypothetical protein